MGGIETVLETNVTGLKAYKYLPDSVNHPLACLIIPDGVFDPEQAFGGNSFKFRFRLKVLLVSGDPESGFNQLTEMMDPTTTDKSIIKAIRTDPTLNGKADTSGIIAIENYGRMDLGNGQFFGFDAILEGYKTVA